MAGQLFYKRKSDGALVPINPGPKGDQGETGLQGPAGPPGPPVATGGITQVDADARYINADGDTMVGNLVLTNEPSADNHPATKAYVDNVFASTPPVNMPTTFGEEESAAGDPVDDPSGATTVHALPYPTLLNGLRTQRALQLLAEALDSKLPTILSGTTAPPEPASNYPEGTVYFRTVV